MHGVPQPVHGLEWNEVYVETGSGARTRLYPDELAVDRLVAPEVECVEFRRGTTPSALAGVLFGSMFGVLAGRYLGEAWVAGIAPMATNRHPGNIDRMMAALWGAGIGLVPGGAWGGHAAHMSRAGNSYPGNACRYCLRSRDERGTALVADGYRA